MTEIASFLLRDASHYHIETSFDKSKPEYFPMLQERS